MAPPRQRPPPNLDDSRSEASSSARERVPTGPKGRRPANATTAAAGATSSKDAKAAVYNLQSHDAEPEGPGISWSSMPLSVLHDYRHVYNLATPSAYSSQIASILLSQGVGLRSPTAIAARRAQAAARRKTAKQTQPSSRAPDKDVTDYFRADGGNNNNTLESTAMSREQSNRGLAMDGSGEQLDLHRISTIRGQGRVSKDHLAMAVRKHFNNVALVEQDAIARFLYKVREEGKGREFRLKFQP